VRDVHPTHYGRICPIETPEGPTSADLVAVVFRADQRVRFIESPYLKVIKGVVINEVRILNPATPTTRWGIL